MEPMTEFVWYARLLTWAGLLVIAIQSVTGRGASFMTALAVVCLVVGLPAFLIGLAREGFSTPTSPGVAGDETTAKATPPLVEAKPVSSTDEGHAP